jgi:hypothetical protein
MYLNLFRLILHAAKRSAAVMFLSEKQKPQPTTEEPTAAETEKQKLQPRRA